MPLYSIRDVQSGFYSPMVDTNDSTAKRNFAYAINNTSIYAYAPKDYDLYRVGSFNTDSGTLEVFPIPELVCTGVSVFNE